MMFYYTYKITFVDGHYYFGSRLSKVTPEKDVYWGSPKTHKDKWKTVMFSKTILSVHTLRQECLEEETKLIKPFYKKDPLCLNENCGGHYNISPEVRRKLIENHKGTKGYKHTEEALRKMREVHKGQMHTDDSKRKMSEKKKGKNHPFYGQTHSQESNQKRKETFKEIEHQQGSKNSMFGKMWITNGTHSYRIDKVDFIPDGYRKGRVMKASPK